MTINLQPDTRLECLVLGPLLTTSADGQFAGVAYLSTVSTSRSRELLDKALSSLLVAVAGDSEEATCLYKLHYEQRSGSASVDVDGAKVGLPHLPLDLAFNDSIMGRVREAWGSVTKDNEGARYMKFDDREGAVDDDRYD